MTRTPSLDGIEDDVFEAAAHWVERARSGMSAAERQAFLAWLQARPEHAAAAESTLQAWQAAPAAARQGGFAPPPAAAPLPHAAPVRWVAPARWVLAPAGAALAALVLGWFARPIETRYTTAPGERRQVALADGSRVWLAPRSRLTARIGWFERATMLETGEAVFDVDHQWRGFSVDAGAVRVVDRGTLFSVRRRTGSPVEVVLAHGAIAVSARADDALLASPMPGESVAIDGGGRAVVRKVDPAATMAWREGRLIFADTSLREALAAFAEQGAPAVRIADSDLSSLRVSGAYAIADLESFLGGVSALYPVRWSHRPDGYEIARR